MRRVLIGLFLLIFPLIASAQLDVTTSFNPAPTSVGYKTAACEDTLGNRLFATRYTSLGPTHWELFKMNIATGATTSLANFATQTNGIPIPTSKIIYRNHRIYVNRRQPSTTFQEIAVFDTSGTLIWSYAMNTGLGGDSIRDFALSTTGDTLFVAGSFTITSPVIISYLAAFNANTGQLFSSWNLNFGGAGLHSLLVRGSILYLGGDFSLGAANNLARITLTSSGPVVDPAWHPNPNGVVLDMANASSTLLVVVGTFTNFTPVATTINRAYFAYVNNTTNTVSNSGPTFSHTVRQIETYHSNQLYVAGDFSTINSTARSNLALLIFPSTLNAWNPSIGGYNSGIRLLRQRNRLYVTTAKQSVATAPYKVYCLAPVSPGTIAFSSTAFCRGSSGITATIAPVLHAASYAWTYVGGTGVTITGSGTTVALQFSVVATSGTLQVTAQADCGLPSIVRSFAINLLPSPLVSAGPDDTLTCIRNTVLLNGSASPSGSLLTWTFPNAQQFSDSVLTTDAGQYILTAVAPNGCSWHDTLQVGIDTVPPALVAFGNVPNLTCTDTSVTLDAAALYPSDSLRWSGPGLLSPANPALVTQSNNFLLTIHKRTNGCESTDTIYVGQNTVIIPATLPATIDTFTCTVTSVVLDAPAATGSQQVWNLVNDTNFLPDPATVSQPGNYLLTVTNLANGCVSSNAVNVNQFITPPGITLPAAPPVLNCSYNSVVLNGSSANVGAGLNWTGPNSFNAPDPATVTQPGTYILTVTHPQNGCTRSDSITVAYVNTLTVSATTDTVICPGSGAQLSVTPVGGTPAFAISWNNGGGTGSPVTVYPGDTLAYIVTVMDAANCIGTDTVIVNVPDVLSDSTQSFQPCDPNQPTGQVQIYPWGGVPPYQYSIDGGTTYQSSGVFGGLGFGNYTVIIRDTLGCTRITNAAIDTNSLSPAPDFLMSTNPDRGDTLVLIDISNPRPDSVNWVFPPSVTVIDSNQFAPVLLYGDTGQFTITMLAYYGSCETSLTRTVTVGPFAPGAASAWNANGIDTLIVYPNPNNGTFSVNLQLEAEQTFLLQVFDANGVERYRLPPQTADEWTGSITIPNAVPGNYQLRVIAEYDSEARIIIVTQ